MEQELNSGILSRQVIEMITVANEYCLFMEAAEKHTREEIFSWFQKVGPLLYLKGSVLPDDVESDPEYNERFVSEEQWEAMFKILREKFAENDIYYTHNEHFDSIEASLADNLADIYQDMKDFILLYQKAPMQSKACALAELQKLFENHWGIKTLHALGAIHSKTYRQEIDPDLLAEW